MIRKLIALLVVFAVVATTMAGPVKVIALKLGKSHINFQFVIEYNFGYPTGL